LLRDVVKLLEEKGYSIGNIDSTVALEAPKVNPHIEDMQTILAEIMKVDSDAVSIKATTSEKIGFVGRKEGVAAYATVLIQK
jgi:2-C-methyl-D-erythritol 2,4-cyclodiphosphate synthase